MPRTEDYVEATLMSAPNGKSPKAGCAALLGVGLILLSIARCGSSDPGSPVTVKTAAPPKLDPYLVRLQREVEALRKSPRLDRVPTDRSGLFTEIALISGRIAIFQDVPARLTREEGEVREQFQRLQAAYQRDAFPKLRKAQASLLRNALWEHDVEVAAVGARSENLRLTGGIFASNRGIKIAQDALGDALQMVRFKRVTYEWYRGSRDTYYDLDPPADGVLAIFGANTRWLPISGNASGKSDCDPKLAASVGLSCTDPGAKQR